MAAHSRRGLPGSGLRFFKLGVVDVGWGFLTSALGVSVGLRGAGWATTLIAAWLAGVGERRRKAVLTRLRGLLSTGPGGAGRVEHFCKSGDLAGLVCACGLVCLGGASECCVSGGFGGGETGLFSCGGLRRFSLAFSLGEGVLGLCLSSLEPAVDRDVTRYVCPLQLPLRLGGSGSRDVGGLPGGVRGGTRQAGLARRRATLSMYAPRGGSL